MSPELEAHLRTFVNFPTPPGIAVRIIELAQDANIDVATVAQTIGSDPALTAKILRIANSPLYAQRRKSENLRQALVVLGLNATLTLALSFTLVRSLRGGKPAGIDYPLYWRRAIIAAICARALGEAIHQPFAEELLLAGLLQDVGMLALDKAVPDLYRDCAQLQQDHRALADHERKRLRVDHAQVGGWLMREWNLPQRLHAAIGRSHRIEQQRTEDGGALFDRCVALSGLLADLFVLGSDRCSIGEIAHGIERSLGLDKEAFGLLLGTISGLIPDTESIFDADLRGAQSPEAILDEARTILVLRRLQALRESAASRPQALGAALRAPEPQAPANRDPATGVHSRAFLDQYLPHEFDGSLRHGFPLSIAVVELDDFKAVNERFGQRAVEGILNFTARTLAGNTRESDLIARLGAADFAVVFPGTDAQTARLICERIVAEFRQATHDLGTQRMNITVSIGCATQCAETPFGSLADLIGAAHQALYTAKLQGSNRSVRFERRAAAPLARFL